MAVGDMRKTTLVLYFSTCQLPEQLLRYVLVEPKVMDLSLQLDI
jgi:hypothetical protein